jgi:hypothetical protein
MVSAFPRSIGSKTRPQRQALKPTRVGRAPYSPRSSISRHTLPAEATFDLFPLSGPWATAVSSLDEAVPKVGRCQDGRACES